MAEFVNTVDKIGSHACLSAYLNDTLEEYYDDHVYDGHVLSYYLFNNKQAIKRIDMPNFNPNQNVQVNGALDHFCRTCQNLEYLNLPSLTYLGNGAISACKNLTELHLDNLARVNGMSTFNELTKIQRMKFPNLTQWGSYLTANQWRPYVVEFGKVFTVPYAMFLYFAPQNVVFRATEGICPYDATVDMMRMGKIYVPQALLNEYKTATNWVRLADLFYPIEGSEFEEV